MTKADKFLKKLGKEVKEAMLKRETTPEELVKKVRERGYKLTKKRLLKIFEGKSPLVKLDLMSAIVHSLDGYFVLEQKGGRDMAFITAKKAKEIAKDYDQTIPTVKELDRQIREMSEMGFMNMNFFSTSKYKDLFEKNLKKNGYKYSVKREEGLNKYFFEVEWF